jgi:hypothetical protein
MSNVNKFEVGALYKATTTTELKKLDVEMIEGLKLNVFPDQVKRLRELQKSLRLKFGKKPDLKFVLNAVLALSNVEQEAIGNWIAEFYNNTNKKAGEIAGHNEQTNNKTLVDLLRNYVQATDQD